MNNELATMTDEGLEQALIAANEAYRNTGSPIMPDEAYDQHVAELSRRNPEHSFLAAVEPEGDFGLGKVRHSRPMLSTSKCYTEAELTQWVRRIESAALDLGLSVPVPIKINAKLDGMAGRLENGVLASRGDGVTGNNITHMFSKGLVAKGEGDGELVMQQAYFDEYLSEEFKHPRNVVTGAVSADTVRPAAKQALEDKSIHFVSYDSLKHVYTDTAAVIETLPVIRKQIIGSCEYPTDGLILVVEAHELRDALGSNSHHHNWMLAAKAVTETAETTVTDILWQIGRTGRASPVVKVSKVELSGAVIGSISAHHAGFVESKGIGPGAVLEITRSGEVIPAIIAVNQCVTDVKLPSACPSCASGLERHRDFLVCPNEVCPDRLKARFKHFFHILGTVDLFGPVACERLVTAGVQSIREVFSMTPADFEVMGFGPGQAANLHQELREARTRPVDDFRVLASLGIEHLGRGDSKRLLKHVALKDVPGLSAEVINGISGFGELTAKAIASTIPSVSDDLVFLERNLTGIITTPAKTEAPTDSPISGKHIVFTGSMTQGSRSEMTAKAEALGAIAQSSVNGKTDYLVSGEKVGASKLAKAEKHGTTILSESEYLALIAQ